MNPIELIDAYYPEDNERKHILLVHSRLVAEKALRIADGHPELNLDKDFLYEAGMLRVSSVLVISLISVTVIWELI